MLSLWDFAIVAQTFLPVIQNHLRDKWKITDKNVCATIYSSYSTGSYPPGWKGWHLNNLLIDFQIPFHNPCLETASWAYWEHVGKNLQLGGSRGEKSCWYILINL